MGRWRSYGAPRPFTDSEMDALPIQLGEGSSEGANLARITAGRTGFDHRNALEITEGSTAIIVEDRAASRPPD